MYNAIYSINGDKRYSGKFQTLVETDNVEDIERMINLQHYPYTVTVLEVTPA